DLHIVPILGALRLTQLTVPLIRGFEDRLRQDGRSPAMVHKARRSLGALLADAQERGLVGQNVVRSLYTRRRSRRTKANGKLKIGIDIPSPDEIRAIIAHLDPLAAPAANRDLHRPARERAARPAMGCRRSKARRAARAPARRPSW